MGETGSILETSLTSTTTPGSQYQKERRRIYPAVHGQWRFEVKKKRQISENEGQRRAWQRAMSLQAFCGRYDIGRTKAYEEINAGRLKARKAGRRTIIADDDAEEWLNLLPAFHEGPNEPSREACAGRDEPAQLLRPTQESLPRGSTIAADALKQTSTSARATRARTRFRAEGRKKTARLLPGAGRSIFNRSKD
jgi:hypothetical protein